MRIAILIVFVTFLMTSCKKDSSSPDQNNSSGKYLSSVRMYTPKSQLVDSFLYNSDHRIAIFSQYIYDTTYGIPVADSILAVFTFPANGGLPTSYQFQIPSNNQFETHQLTFDGQNRIVKDSSTHGFSTTYSYPTNRIVSRLVFVTGDDQVDTMVLSNGNIVSELIYYPNSSGTADSLSASIQFFYTSFANPAYQQEIANSVGPLIFLLGVDGYGGIADYVSKGLFNKISAFSDGMNRVGNYDAVTDAAGKVVLVNTDAYGPGSYVKYSYN